MTSKLSTELYKNVGQQQAQQQQAGDPGSDTQETGDTEAKEQEGEVIDAEYEDLDKDKK